MIEQSGGRLAQLKGPQPGLDLRAGARERREQAGGQLAAGGHVKPDRQHAARHLSGVAGRGGGAIEGGQRVSGAVEEGAARGRDRHSAARSLKQPDAQHVLDLADLRAEDLLGDMDAARRSGEAALLGNRHEVPQVPQFDGHVGRWYRAVSARREGVFPGGRGEPGKTRERTS